MSETTEPTNKTLLEEIRKLSGKIDPIGSKVNALESKVDSHDAQFEAIRRGLIQNSAAFDRLESIVYTVRSDVSARRMSKN